MKLLLLALLASSTCIAITYLCPGTFEPIGIRAITGITGRTVQRTKYKTDSSGVTGTSVASAITTTAGTLNKCYPEQLNHSKCVRNLDSRRKLSKKSKESKKNPTTLAPSKSLESTIINRPSIETSYYESKGSYYKSEGSKESKQSYYVSKGSYYKGSKQSYYVSKGSFYKGSKQSYYMSRGSEGLAEHKASYQYYGSEGSKGSKRSYYVPKGSKDSDGSKGSYGNKGSKRSYYESEDSEGSKGSYYGSESSKGSKGWIGS
eukprot:jgi/Psemu1/57480/gm1.57480_g